MKKDFDIKKIKKDAKKFLEKAKISLKKVGEETAIFAKRSEKELAKVSRAGRRELDILNLNIKKNQIYYQIGKKVHQLHSQDKLSTRPLKKLCSKLDEIEKNIKTKKRSSGK